MSVVRMLIRLVVAVFLLTPLTGSAQVANPTSPSRVVGTQKKVTEEGVVAAPDIRIALNFPAGKSPKVFTKGWVFGAVATEQSGVRAQRDITGEVRWKGTATFQPDRGSVSRPIFKRPGANTITLYVERDGKIVAEKTFTVEAVDPGGYARVGGLASGPADAHGCPACPHPVRGPITTGSPNVSIDGIPAARVGDTGTHAACCGPNQFVIKTGDPTVLIDGKPAARVGDQTQHCGGSGKIESAGGTR